MHAPADVAFCMLHQPPEVAPHLPIPLFRRYVARPIPCLMLSPINRKPGGHIFQAHVVFQAPQTRIKVHVPHESLERGAVRFVKARPDATGFSHGVPKDSDGMDGAFASAVSSGATHGCIAIAARPRGDRSIDLSSRGGLTASGQQNVAGPASFGSSNPGES